MRAKIKLNNEEYRAFLRIVKLINKDACAGGEDMSGIQIMDAMLGLVARLTTRIPNLNDSNRLSLSEMETMVTYYSMRRQMKGLPPYEQALAIKMLDAMDRQVMEAYSTRKANLFGSDEEQKLLIP